MDLNTRETIRVHLKVMAKYGDYINPDAYWREWTAATVERMVKAMQIPLVRWRQVRFGELAHRFNKIQKGLPF